MTAFLFDLDGTLHDSVPVICHVSQLAYAELGLERSLEEIKKTIGVPLVKTGEELFGPGNGDLYRLTYQRIYQEQESLFPLRAFPGIPEMLSALRESALKDDEIVEYFFQQVRENLVMEDHYLILLIHDGYLYACTSAGYPTSRILLRRAKIV